MSRRLFIGSFFDGGLVDEHYRNIVADGVNTFTLDTFQSLSVGRDFHVCLASRTREYLQEFLTDCHGLDLSKRHFVREMLKDYHKALGGRLFGVRRPGAALVLIEQCR